MTSQQKTGLNAGPGKTAPKNRNTEISKARKAAFAVLMAVERGQAHSDDLLRGKAVNALSPADRNLATALVLGVLRWQIRLDHQLQALLARPNAKLDAEILIALRLGAFQILQMDRIPARAAIDESVELAKQAGHRFASAMVNAVLRKLGKASQSEPERLTSQSELEQVALKGHDFSRAVRAAISTRALAPEGSLSDDIEAHPAWIVERWINLYGMETARAICRHGQSQPKLTVRLVAPEVEAELVHSGIVLEPGELLTAARIVVHGDVTATAAFREGRVRLQDEGSQLVAELAACASDILDGKVKSILDACAAPGGKMLILAERNPKARIVAYESSAPRLRQLQDRLAHLGERVESRLGDATALTEDAAFDIALADVPCSGTGTLGRNPEIRHRLRPEDLSRQAARQRAIFSAALRAVRPGGSVFYSSCSLEPEENELVVAAVLAATPNARPLSLEARIGELLAAGILTPSGAERLRGVLTPEGFLSLLPGVFQTDGFFIAMIVRGENQA
ncbi:MAG: transcription antitermination factor NusB [Terracidiphilus sp.]